MCDQYFIRDRGRVSGPFTIEQLKEMAMHRRFARHYQVSVDKITWERAAKSPELFPPAPTESNRTAPLADDAEVRLPTGPGEPVNERVYSSTESQSSTATAAQWYYTHNDQDLGPVTLEGLSNLAACGDLMPEDYVWADGMDIWIEARSMPEIRFWAEALDPLNSQDESALAETPRSASMDGAYGSPAPMAVASLIFGLCGTTVLFFVGSILAVILGHLALKQIRTDPGEIEGRGMAIAGLFLGYSVLISVTVVGIVMSLMHLMRGEVAPPV